MREVSTSSLHTSTQIIQTDMLGMRCTQIRKEEDLPGNPLFMRNQNDKLDLEKGVEKKPSSPTSEVEVEPLSKHRRIINHGWNLEELKLMFLAWLHFGFLLVWAFVAGTDIGYALGVTGGLLAMPSFKSEIFPAFYKAEAHAGTTYLCPYTETGVNLFSSSIHVTASISIWMVYFLTLHWRREKFILSCALVVKIIGIFIIIKGYIITGYVIIGVSLAFMLHMVPILSSELAPVQWRWISNATYQGGIAFGGVLAPLVNFAASTNRENRWRLPFYVMFGPPLFIFLILMFLRGIPKNLMKREKYGEAWKTLRYIRMGDVMTDFREEIKQVEEELSFKDQLRNIFRGCNLPVFVINTTATILPKLAGTAALLFFAPLLVESFTSSFKAEPFLAPAYFSLVMIGFQLTYLIILFLLPRRKWPIVISLICMVVSQAALCGLFSKMNKHHHFHGSEKDVALIVFLPLALGQTLVTGPHGWISCPFDENISALGSAWTNSLSLMMDFLMNQLLFLLFCSIGEFTFLVFMAVSIITIIFVLVLVPETTGVEKDEIEDKIWKLHWIWKRCKNA